MAEPLNPRRQAPAPLGEKLGTLRYVPRLLALVWEAHRGFTVSMIAIRVARSLIPVASLWIAKLIIDAVIRANRGASGALVWRYVALEIAIVLSGEILTRSSNLIESLLGDLFTNHVSVRLMEHAATLDLAQFEDPAFYDHLERARQQTSGRITLIIQLLTMLQDTLTIASLAIALISQGPWLVVLLVVALLPSFWGETHYASLTYSLLYGHTPARRALDYLRYLGASNETAKEVQIFGLAPWLARRFRLLSSNYYEKNRHLAIRRATASSALSLVAMSGYYAAYVLILRQALAGTITIGSLTFLAGAFVRSRDLVQRQLLLGAEVFKETLYLRDLFTFFEMRSNIISPEHARAVPVPIRDGFRFEDVGFRYPGGEHWAVRHVNLCLRPGERVALVGENGAGKTTITKLMARLYDPTEGRILLDGVDLCEYDLSAVREAIGVIFQDFVRYDMRFEENIAVGEIAATAEYLEGLDDARKDGAASESLLEITEVLPRIVEAADRSLASSLRPRFKHGYRQMLGRRFEGGVELSGGEWQKVALARAYMRNAQLIILDEPTAALDARAEYEVFLRFSELMAGRMAVVISHRFSAVRMAERIIVLSGGMVVEQGTHDALLERQGLYAELFELQAVGYR